MATYPNVPDAPGVPPVPRDGPAPAPPAAATEDAPTPSSAITGPQWGIFNADMSPAIVGESVVSVAKVAESKISTYPVEAASATASERTPSSPVAAGTTA